MKKVLEQVKQEETMSKMEKKYCVKRGEHYVMDVYGSKDGSGTGATPISGKVIGVYQHGVLMQFGKINRFLQWHLFSKAILRNAVVEIY